MFLYEYTQKFTYTVCITAAVTVYFAPSQNRWVSLSSFYLNTSEYVTIVTEADFTEVFTRVSVNKLWRPILINFKTCHFRFSPSHICIPLGKVTFPKNFYIKWSEFTSTQMAWMAYLKNSLTINVTSVYSSFVSIYTNKGQSLSTLFCSHKLPAPITNNTSTDFKPTRESPKKPMCFPIYLFIYFHQSNIIHTHPNHEVEH